MLAKEDDETTLLTTRRENLTFYCDFLLVDSIDKG